MDTPIQRRGSWIVRVNGIKRRFLTEDAAWEAIGGKPVEEVQEEFEWIPQEVKLSRDGKVGSLFSMEEDSDS